MGSVVVGPSDFIHKVHRARKLLGGAMRQVRCADSPTSLLTCLAGARDGSCTHASIVWRSDRLRSWRRLAWSLCGTRRHCWHRTTPMQSSLRRASAV